VAVDGVAREQVRAALSVASPALSRQIDDIVAFGSRDVRTVRRVVISLASYVLRWQQRPTPFGLFAGVGLARIGVRAEVRWGREHRVTVRADAAWLGDVLARLHQCPELLERLSVVVNDAGSVRGDRFVAPGPAPDGVPQALAPIEVSVRHSRPVRTALETACEPVDSAVTQNTERAALKVLTGTPLMDAAIAEGMEPADLAEAIEVYRRAGLQALEQQTASGWWQLYIQFTDWSNAEHAAADHLAPLLRHAEEDDVVTAWGFMRKHPCWRLRLQAGPAGSTMKAGLGAAFDELVADGRIGSWSPGIYEAETAAFGGDEGMDLAHELFCEDSRAVLDLLRDGGSGLGRRKLSLLLCSILMRAAGLEWYEQATSGTGSHWNDAWPPTSRPRS
jgi:hypothetical protein